MASRPPRLDPEDEEELPRSRLRAISQIVQAFGAGQISEDSARSRLEGEREEELFSAAADNLGPDRRAKLQAQRGDIELPGENGPEPAEDQEAPDPEGEEQEDPMSAGLDEFAATPDTTVTYESGTATAAPTEDQEAPPEGPQEAPEADREGRPDMGRGLDEFGATPDTTVDYDVEEPEGRGPLDWMREEIGGRVQALIESAEGFTGLDSAWGEKSPAGVSPAPTPEEGEAPAATDERTPAEVRRDERAVQEVMEEYRRAREEGPGYEPGGIFEPAEVEAWEERIWEPDSYSQRFIRQGLMDEAMFGPEEGRGEPPERDLSVAERAIQGIDVGSGAIARGLGSLVELTGRMTGSEEITEWGEGQAEAQERERQEERAEGITTPSVTEAFDSPHNFAEWATYATTQGVTTSAPMIGGGMLASLLGGGTLAVGTAVALPAYALVHGELRKTLEDAGMEPGWQREAVIAAGAVPLAALELAMEAGVVTRAFGRTARREAIDNLVDFGKKWLKASVRRGAEEGVTEELQTLGQHGIAAMATGREFLTSELGAEMIEAGPAGFMGGAPFGTVDAATQVDPVRLREANRAVRRSVASFISPELQAEAQEDPLTGLDNRNGMERKTERREPAPNTERVEIHGDIDNMKHINNELGHEDGDRAIQVVADAIRGATRGDDVVSVARTGGDEFVITMDLPEGENPGPIINRVEQRANDALATYGPEGVDATYAEPAPGKEVGVSFGLGDEGMYQRKEERGVSDTDFGVTEGEAETQEDVTDQTGEAEPTEVEPEPAEDTDTGTEAEEAADIGPYVTEWDGGRITWGSARDWLHGVREIVENEGADSEAAADHLSSLAANADLIRQETDPNTIRNILDFARGRPDMEGASRVQEEADARLEKLRARPDVQTEAGPRGEEAPATEPEPEPSYGPAVDEEAVLDELELSDHEEVNEVRRTAARMLAENPDLPEGELRKRVEEEHPDAGLEDLSSRLWRIRYDNQARDAVEAVRAGEEAQEPPTTDQEAQEVSEGPLETIDVKVPLSELADVDLTRIVQNVMRRQAPGWEQDLARLRDELDARDMQEPEAVQEPEAEDAPLLSGEDTGGVRGAETTLRPVSGEPIQAQYKAIPIQDAVPSHNPVSFDQSAVYPQALQPRSYHANQQAQESVMEFARTWDPDIYLDLTQLPVSGPSQVSPTGIVLGGNNRVMSAMRVYEMDEAKAEEFRAAQIEQAEKFGLDPDAVRQIENPIIVREVTDPGILAMDESEIADLGARLNEDPQKASDPLDEAVTLAARLESPEAEDALDQFLENVKPDETLRAFMGRAAGRTFMENLVKLNVVPHQESGQYFTDDGSVTGGAKDLVERMFKAAVIEDRDLLATAPSSEVRKIEKAVPAILKAARVEGYDVRPEIQEALVLLRRVRNSDEDSVEAFLQQTSLLDEDYSALGVAMAEFMERNTRNPVSEAFRAFAADAERTRQARIKRESAGELFGDPPPLPDPAEQFQKRFINEDFSVAQVDIPGLEGGAHRAYESSYDVTDREPISHSDPYSTRGLETETFPGRKGDTSHTTARQEGQIPTSALWPWEGARGEQRGNHRKRTGEEWEEFKEHIAANGIQAPIFVTVDPGQDPQIAEGNHRLDAAHELGMEMVPVEISYFGKAEDQGFVIDRAAEETGIDFDSPRRSFTMGQGDMFAGSDAPAEGGEQFDMFTGQNDEYTKDNLTQAEKEAAEAVRELGPAVENGSASEEQLAIYNEARKLLRRSEKWTADEIRLLARERQDPGIPQAEGQQDMFGGPTRGFNVRRGGTPLDPTTEDYMVEKLASESMRDVGPQRTEAYGPEETPPDLPTRGPFGTGQEYVPTRQEILENLSRALRVPITTNKARFGKAFGFYKVTPESVKLKWAQDVETGFHEIGHHMHWLLFGEDGLTDGGDLSNKPLDPWRDELEPLAEGVSDESLVEGEAEFFRRYLNSEEGRAAREYAPEFYEFVESRLQQSEPAAYKALQTARRHYQIYREVDAEREILANQKSAAEGQFAHVYDRVRYAVRKLVQDVVDYEKPIDQYEEEMTGEGETPWELAAEVHRRHAHGATSVAEEWLEHNAIDFEHNEVGPSLAEILAPVHEELESFTAYALAMRANERHSKGYETGFRQEAVEEVLNRHAGKEHFRTALEQIQQFREHQLQYLVDGGVITPQTKAAILEKSNWYVPLYSAAQETVRGEVRGGSFANIQQAVHHYRGSSQIKLNPIDALIQDTYLFTNLVARQQTALRIAGLSQEKGAGPWMEKVAQPVEVTNVSVGEALEGIRDAIGRRTQDISGEDLMGALQGEGPGEQFVGETADIAEEFGEVTGQLLEELPQDVLEEMFMVLRPGDYFGDRDGFSVRLPDGNGNMKRYWFQVHDELLWNALQSANQPRLEDLGWVRHLLGLWRGPASVLRRGATIAPIFSVVRNPQRDIPTSAIFSEYGLTPVVDHARGMFHLINKGEWYRRFIRGGGKFGATVIEDRNQIARKMREFSDSNRSLTAVAKDYWDMAADLSALWENQSRMAEFMNAYRYWRVERGVSRREAEIRAGAAGRDNPSDFAIHGAKTHVLRSISTFWNAAMVGYERTVRAFKQHPYRSTWRAFKYITIPELILFGLNYDNEDYWELPEWLRATFWHVPIPKDLAHAADFIVPDSIADIVTYSEGEGLGSEIASRFDQGQDTYFIRIARPHILGQIFGYAPLKGLEAMVRDDQEAGRAAKEVAMEVGARNLLDMAPIPQTWEILIQAKFGYDTWQMRNVVPQDLQGVDPQEQYTPTTSPTAKGLADFLSMAPGMEFSPIKIESSIEQVGGNLGRMALRTGDAAGEAAGLTDDTYTGRGMQSIPVIGGLFDEPYAYQPQSVSDLYNEWQGIRQTYDTWRKMQERGNYEEAEQYRQEHSAEHGLYYQIQPIIETLRFYRGQTDRIRRSDVPSYRDREAMQKLKFRDVQKMHRNMAKIARSALGRIQDARERQEEPEEGGR